MERNYNHIYSKLVSENSDLVGHVAYSIYKKSKIEYIENQKQDGKILTDAELIPFNCISSSETSIESYKIKAELIVQEFIENVLQQELTNYKNQAINQQSAILKDIIKPLTTPFFMNVLAGVVASFFFALILALIFFIKTFGDTNISLNFEPKAAQKDTIHTK